MWHTCATPVVAHLCYPPRTSVLPPRTSVRPSTMQKTPVKGSFTKPKQGQATVGAQPPCG